MPDDTRSEAAGRERWLARHQTELVLLVVLVVLLGWVVGTDGPLDALPVLVLILGALVILEPEMQLYRRLRSKAARIGTRALPAKAGKWLRGCLRSSAADALWLLPLLGFAATVLAVQEQKDNPAFLSAAAEIVAVLVIALAIETHALRHRLRDDRRALATAFITLGLLIYGEYEALDGLDDPGGKDAEIVWGALAAGALGVLIVALRFTPPDPPRSQGAGNSGTS